MAYVLRYALGLAEALEEMHYRGVAHGDVYAHNVLADEEGNVFLCDYGEQPPLGYLLGLRAVLVGFGVRKEYNGGAVRPCISTPSHAATAAAAHAAQLAAPHCGWRPVLVSDLTCCLPAGASFFYSRKSGVPFEGQEVRAYGLLLNDLVQRLDVPFQGGESGHF